nr:hypothetical protein [Deltaproteobacteria bacterium]
MHQEPRPQSGDGPEGELLLSGARGLVVAAVALVLLTLVSFFFDIRGGSRRSSCSTPRRSSWRPGTAGCAPGW